MKRSRVSQQKTPASTPLEKQRVPSEPPQAWRWLLAFLVLLGLLFLISLFKNISYPLFWADESMTVMGGERVLEYGYPKVHDGRNVFYDLQHPDKSLGVDERTDAYIGGANWGMYYVAAPGIKLAKLSDDLYVQTGVIRALFAFFGMIGLILWAAFAARLFGSLPVKLVFLICFTALTLISISLVLHLREVRYYSLTVFLTAAAAHIYCSRRILNAMTFRQYMALLTISLILMFVVFSPAYIVFLITIAAFECTLLSIALIRPQIYDKKDRRAPGILIVLKPHLLQALPLFMSLVAVYPLMLFFETFHISQELSEFYAAVFDTDALGMYLKNLSLAWRYFSSLELFYLAIVLKTASILLRVMAQHGKHSRFIDTPKALYTFFLTLFFMVYIFVIAKIPNPLFTRYLIPVQPVLSLIILLDGAILYETLSRYRSKAGIISRRLLVPVCAVFICINILTNYDIISGHIYELAHRYEGPLDYVIPFIKKQYPDTRSLVIATNYEETSFMYYLDAKVIIGYVGYNLEEDARATPDVISYRRYWNNFVPEFESFLNRGTYEKVDFPVADYAVNNIPELDRDAAAQHLFRTLEPDYEIPETYLLLKK